MEKLKVLIIQQRGWGIRIGHFLAKKLQEEGCSLAALTFKKTTHEFVLNQKDVKYDFIINNDEIMGRPDKYLAGDSFDMDEICRSIGVDTLWPIFANMRNFVMSYKDKYYYAFRQNVSDEISISYMQAWYKCIKEIFDQFNPDLIITPNFVAFPHIMLNLYALKRGIKMIGVTDSKVRGINIFTHSYQNDQGEFCERADVLNSGLEISPNKEKAREYISEFRKSFIKPQYTEYHRKSQKSIKERIKNSSLGLLLYIIRWYVKRPINVLDSTGISGDYRPPRILIRDYICKRKYKKFMDKFSYYPFDNIKKFVYFPLQFQPEETIDVMAPLFNNQIETARQVAMSLPGEYTLVVKEHPEMAGLRPPSYIEKISRQPNIKLIDYRIDTGKILENTALVVSPNSTTLAEAAFYNIPAIQLGNLGTTQKLPNVVKHSDMSTLSSKIREVLSWELKNEEYESRLENYVSAVYDTGFDFNYLGVWERNEKENMELLWDLYRNEIERYGRKSSAGK